MIAGIDIGGTTTKIGLVDEGRVIAQTRIPTTGHADDHAFADALAREVRAAGEAMTAGRSDRRGHRRTQCEPAHGHHRDGAQPAVEVRRAARAHDATTAWCSLRIGQRCERRQRLVNGATVPARVATICSIVTLGTGVGSGFIVNGQLMLGSHGNAGELGHMTLVMDGRPCTCGRKGCLEAYVSIRGLRETYTELDGDPEVMKEEGVKCIADAAHRGDAAALQTFKHAVRWLAVGLANAVTITGPQRIVLFGGIARNGDLLMAPLRDRFQEALLNIYKGRVDSPSPPCPMMTLPSLVPRH